MADAMSDVLNRAAVTRPELLQTLVQLLQTFLDEALESGSDALGGGGQGGASVSGKLLGSSSSSLLETSSRVQVGPCC